MAKHAVSSTPSRTLPKLRHQALGRKVNSFRAETAASAHFTMKGHTDKDAGSRSGGRQQDETSVQDRDFHA